MLKVTLPTTLVTVEKYDHRTDEESERTRHATSYEVERLLKRAENSQKYEIIYHAERRLSVVHYTENFTTVYNFMNA